MDEDDKADFEEIRKVCDLICNVLQPLSCVVQELRTFMDSTLIIDPGLVTESVRSLALTTLTAYQNGVSLKWNDAELAVYLVYVFGEINKCKSFRASPRLNLVLICIRSWRQRASSILSSPSYSGQRQAKRDGLLRVSTNKSRRDALRACSIRNLLVPTQNCVYAVLRDGRTLR